MDKTTPNETTNVLLNQIDYTVGQFGLDEKIKLIAKILLTVIQNLSGDSKKDIFGKIHKEHIIFGNPEHVGKLLTLLYGKIIGDDSKSKDDGYNNLVVIIANIMNFTSKELQELLEGKKDFLSAGLPVSEGTTPQLIELFKGDDAVLESKMMSLLAGDHHRNPLEGEERELLLKDIVKDEKLEAKALQFAKKDHKLYGTIINAYIANGDSEKAITLYASLSSTGNSEFQSVYEKINIDPIQIFTIMIELGQIDQVINLVMESNYLRHFLENNKENRRDRNHTNELLHIHRLFALLEETDVHKAIAFISDPVMIELYNKRDKLAGGDKYRNRRHLRRFTKIMIKNNLADELAGYVTEYMKHEKSDERKTESLANINIDLIKKSGDTGKQCIMALWNDPAIQKVIINYKYTGHKFTASYKNEIKPLDKNSTYDAIVNRLDHIQYREYTDQTIGYEIHG